MTSLEGSHKVCSPQFRKYSQERFTGEFLSAISFFSFLYFTFFGWTRSTLSKWSPVCTRRRGGWIGWTLPLVAMKAGHIPRLGFCGLSPIKPCNSSVSETFPVSFEMDGWILCCSRLRILNVCLHGILQETKESYQSPRHRSGSKSTCSWAQRTWAGSPQHMQWKGRLPPQHSWNVYMCTPLHGGTHTHSIHTYII